MSEWMVKGKMRADYLRECSNVDLDKIQSNQVLMNMFNKPEQYITVMNRIVELFGSLDKFRICEIGGGYGGQAKVILDNYNPACYHMIDLPEPLALQQRYLNGYPVELFSEPTGQKYDLVISNYAISEIPDNKLYIDEVLRKSLHGYITCNTDLVKLDWSHQKLPDIPGERKTNYVLVW